MLMMIHLLAYLRTHDGRAEMKKGSHLLKEAVVAA